MKAKRVLAILLSLAMLISVMPLSGLTLLGSAAESTVTYYIDATNANGTDRFATIDAAAAAASAATATDFIFVIVGDATMPADFTVAGKHVTFTGDTSAATLTANSYFEFHSDVTLDNLTLTSTTYSASSRGRVSVDACKLITTANFRNSYNTWELFMIGDNVTNAGFSRYEQNCPAGSGFILLFAGANAASSAITWAGTEIVLNAGYVQQVSIGGRANVATTLTGPITLSEYGTCITAGTPATQGFTTVMTPSATAGTGRHIIYGGEGAGIQLLDDKLRATPNIAAFCDTHEPAFASAVYQVKVTAQTGSKVTPTAKAGVYDISGSMVAVATNTADNTVIKSVGGVLDLTGKGAGTYTITWENSTEAADLYVDSAAETTGNGTEASPFKTLAEALTKAAGRESANIYLSGTVALDADVPATTNGITITSKDESNPAIVTLSSVITVKGDLTLGTMKMAISAAGADRGIALAGVNFTTQAGFQSGWLSSDLSVAQNNSNAPTLYPGGGAGVATVTKPNKVVLHGGRFASITFSSYGVDTTYNAGATVDIVVDGASVSTGTLFFFSRNGSTRTAVYNDNIYLHLKKGATTNAQVWGAETKFATGKGLYIVQESGYGVGTEGFSDVGGNSASTSLAAVQSATYWIKHTDSTQGTVTPNGTLGSFAVTSEKIAVATKGDTAVDSVDGVLTLPTGGIYTITWKVPAADTSALDVYVDETDGLDDNAGTQDAPVKTIDRALELLSGRESGTILLKTDATLPATVPVTTTEGPITLKGASDKVKLHAVATQIKNDLIIDNVDINSTLAEGASYYFALDGIDLTFGANTTVTKRPEIALIGDGVTAAARSSLTLNGGKIYGLWLGANGGSATPTIAGADVTVNGGAIYAIYLQGRNGKAVTVSDDVNINFIAGEISDAKIYKWASRTLTFSGDAALKIMQSTTFDGGVGTDDALNIGATDAQLADINAHYYKVKYPLSSGQSIVANNTAVNTFNAVGGAIAVATNTADGAVVVESANDGLLTLPQAGVYTVSWKLRPEAFVTYVDLTNGNDANTGADANNAFLTMDKAIAAIQESINSNGIIHMTGTLNAGTLLTHAEKPIVIQGADAATATIKGQIIFGGPITLKNVTLATGVTLRANGYPLTVDSDVVAADGTIFYSGVGSGNNTIGKEAIILNTGNYSHGYLGPKFSTGNTNNVQGILYVQNGGNIEWLEFGSDQYGGNATTPGSGFKQITYTGDVNIVLNAGQIGQITTETADDAYPNHQAIFNGAVQIVVNGEACLVTPAKEFRGATAIWNIDARNKNGYGLMTTDVAGVYTLNEKAVADGVVAYAYDKNGHFAESVDGTLTLPAVGDYTVEFAATASAYINAGTAVKFYADTTLSLAEIVADEISGKFFLGWKNGDTYPVDGTSVEAGTVLTATYVDMSADFTASSTQLRPVSDTTDKADLRFIINWNMGTLKTNAEFASMTINEYGAVALPSTFLTIDNDDLSDRTSGTLKIGGKYLYADGRTYEPVVVKATNIYKNDIGGVADNMQYTICLTNNKSANYDRRYAVRGYVKYTDNNGVARVQYTDEKNESLTSTANKTIAVFEAEGEEVDPLFPALVQNGKNSILAKYENGTVSYPLINSSSSFSMGTNGQVKDSTGKVINKYYKLDDQQMLVNEITITGVGDTTGRVVQISDTHLNAFNNEDIKQGHPSVMESVINDRQNNFNTNLSIGLGALRNVQRAMEYAYAWGDQTVLSGDVIDGLALGSLELYTRHVKMAYPESIYVNGNHDIERMWGEVGNSTPDYAPEDACREVLQSYITNDLEYYSKLLDGGVMVIQMDNGIGNLRDAALLAPLQADLATARENGYTVLIFTHVPLQTGDSADTAVPSLTGKSFSMDFTKAPSAHGGTSSNVWKEIVKYGDVVRGVFNGHTHAGFYTEINAKDENGEDTIIPQYTLNGGSYYSYSEILKITVKPQSESAATVGGAAALFNAQSSMNDAAAE